MLPIILGPTILSTLTFQAYLPPLASFIAPAPQKTRPAHNIIDKCIGDLTA